MPLLPQSELYCSLCIVSHLSAYLLTVSLFCFLFPGCLDLTLHLFPSRYFFYILLLVYLSLSVLYTNYVNRLLYVNISTHFLFFNSLLRNYTSHYKFSNSGISFKHSEWC
jgi:hypothetical protein